MPHSEAKFADKNLIRRRVFSEFALCPNLSFVGLFNTIGAMLSNSADEAVAYDDRLVSTFECLRPSFKMAPSTLQLLKQGEAEAGGVIMGAVPHIGDLVR